MRFRGPAVALVAFALAASGCTDRRPDPPNDSTTDGPTTTPPVSITPTDPPTTPGPEFTPPAELAACPGEVDPASADPLPVPTDPPSPVAVTTTEVELVASDGEALRAVLSVPGGVEDPPGIVLLHGGFGRRPAPAQAEALAGLGFAVIDPEYRPNDVGGGELLDAVAAAEHLRSALGLERGRIAAFGTSHGASIAVLAAARFPGRFAAVVWISGAADWACIWQLDDGGGISRTLERSTGTTPDQDFLAYAERSPLYWASTLRVPVYVTHSEHDGTVPTGQSQLLVDALREAGVPVEWHLASADGHHFLEDEPFDGPDWSGVLGFLDRTIG